MPANAMVAFRGGAGELSTFVASSASEGVTMRLLLLPLALSAFGLSGRALAEQASDAPAVTILRGSSAPAPPPQVIEQTVVYPQTMYVPDYYPTYFLYHPGYYSAYSFFQPRVFRHPPFATTGTTFQLRHPPFAT